LVHEGKLALGAIEGALRQREKLIREVTERLAALGVEGFGLAGRANKGARAGLRKAETAARKTRKKPVSAAVKKTRQDQGRYLGAIRQLSKASRKTVKAIREKSGVAAAIAAAKKMKR
jgi:Tfp pilus assembly protein PilX